MFENDQNGTKTPQKKSQPNYLIRILVCAFILYLAYQIISDLVKNNFQKDNSYLLLAVGVVMALCSAVIIFISLRDMVRSGKKDLAEYDRLKTEEALPDEEASDEADE